jgi:hypothetical protein
METRVVIEETGKTIEGPTSVEAPYLASELLATLLVEAPADSTVRIAMTLPVMLTFSFELHAPVVERLAELGASLELCINTDEPRFDQFDCYENGIRLHVWTGDRDPADVTVRTDVVPTHVHRVGDHLGGPNSKRTIKRGSWNLEYEHEPPAELSELVDAVCDRFSPAAADACRDYDLVVRFTFMIENLQGGLRFDRDALARIAALRVPLACYFYNMGA